jgi:cytochrome c peroxidase
MLYTEAMADAGPAALEDLGRMLFFDTRLSAGENQSCATCHDPSRAFTDPRQNGVAGAASLGSDGSSLGDRNAAGLTYAARTPPFHRRADGNYVGGFFHDGRAESLVEQAKQPLTSATEMALPGARAVRERLRDNPAYVTALARALGPDALSSPRRALQAAATAIAAFQNTAEFAPFDSRYDRYLRGEIELSEEEELGRILFFSGLINCNSCHLLDQRENRGAEVFTNHRYHNIGVPANALLRARNGLGEDYRDTGLLQNPAVRDPAQAGRFRVPSLRNVAVTGPYMHNGVFRDLATAIVFYNRFLLGSGQAQVNPETGEPWGEAEVPDTVDFDLLRVGQPLTGKQVAQLLAFLEALTDRRYEHLLQR